MPAGSASEAQGSPGHHGAQDRGQQLPPAGPSFSTRRSSEAFGEASMNACAAVAACSLECRPSAASLSCSVQRSAYTMYRSYAAELMVTSPGPLRQDRACHTLLPVRTGNRA